MSQSLQKQPIKVNLHQNQRLSTYKDVSYVSNNDSISQHLNLDPQTVDFEQYLYTEHFSPSEEHHESNDYNQDGSDRSNQSHSEFYRDSSEDMMQNKKILIEIGQNYTFADEMSSHRKGNQKHADLKCFPQLNKKLINLYPLSYRNKSPKPSETKFSSTSSVLIPSHSQMSQQSSSKEISLSDNQQDQALTIYKTKQIQEEMFLKISEQTKQILQLQQKLYYYQDFCKRLLKSQSQSSNAKKNLANQLKNVKKKSKAQTKTIKQLELNLLAKQKQIQLLKQTSSQIVTQYRTNQRTNSLTKRQAQRKTLLEKQNFQNITLLQSQNKIINQKYQSLLQKYEITQTKTFDLKKQIQKLKKDNDILKKKSLNVQNMNKILSKEIQQLNIKVFQIQSQMQKVMYDKYASNLIRIKNFNFEGFKEANLRNSPLIPESFETTRPMSLKRS